MSNEPYLTLREKSRTEPFRVAIGEARDGVHVRRSHRRLANALIHNTISGKGLQAPHLDAIQLIPDGDFSRSWYAGASACGIRIGNCFVNMPDTQYQGIFAGDGLYESLQIINNTISTESEHEITICGMLSGEIAGNVDGQGKPSQVLLKPLRLFGSPDDGEQSWSLWVIGFKENLPCYEAISLGAESRTCLDWRTTVFNQYDCFMTDVDLPAVYEMAKGLDSLLSAEEWCRAGRAKVFEFGSVVQWGNAALTQKQVVTDMIAKNKMGSVFDPVEQFNLDGQVTIGIAINNPCCIKDYGTWRGEVAQEDMPDWMKKLAVRRPDLIRFEHPKYGIRAALHLLLIYQQKHGLKSVAEIINRWSPYRGAGADNSEAQTSGYVRHVAQRLGVDPSETIAVRDYKTAKQFVTAMIEYENGHMQPYSDAMLDEGIEMAGIRMPEEQPIEVKPPMKSSERKGAVAIATGSVGSVVVSLGTLVGLSKEQSAAVATIATEAAKQAVATQLDWMQWLLLANSVGMLLILIGAFWWWKGRKLAGLLLLR
ncbi:hypothetical protein [Thiolinea disciformis]|uniref:hypothetical protein n=1 Tax=Thiolinea disciformis TaxID=125614 RepID=UPI0012FEE003|nr:hypothetical protein [Thiolinea disciformis]